MHMISSSWKIGGSIHLFESRYILPLHCHILSSASTGVAWQWIRSTHLLSRINPLLLSFQVPRERRGEKNETAKSAFQFSPPSPEPDTIARGYAWAAHTLLCLQVLVQSAHVKLPTGYCKSCRNLGRNQGSLNKPEPWVYWPPFFWILS